nr:MAG TPA: hypothetical protein [Caudoviricetes sp.]
MLISDFFIIVKIPDFKSIILIYSLKIPINQGFFRTD